MIPNVGPLEIAIVLIIALIIFGPKKLPELGRSVGRGINEFREGLSHVGKGDDEDDDEDDLEPEPTAISAPSDAGKDPLPGEEPEVTEVTGEVVSEKND